MEQGPARLGPTPAAGKIALRVHERRGRAGHCGTAGGERITWTNELPASQGVVPPFGPFVGTNISRSESAVLCCHRRPKGSRCSPTAACCCLRVLRVPMKSSPAKLACKTGPCDLDPDRSGGRHSLHGSGHDPIRSAVPTTACSSTRQECPARSRQPRSRLVLDTPRRSDVA